MQMASIHLRSPATAQASTESTSCQILAKSSTDFWPCLHRTWFDKISAAITVPMLVAAAALYQGRWRSRQSRMQAGMLQAQLL